jgi:hypothetical protein
VGWVGRRAWAACEGLGALLRHGRRAGAELADRMSGTCAAVRARMGTVSRFKLPLLSALAVGVGAGVAAYYAGPWLAAGVSAVGGFATTIVVHAALWLRRTLGWSIIPSA